MGVLKTYKNHNLIIMQRYSFEQRLNESTMIRRKYPNRIPVICKRSESSHLKMIDKKKYLVPNDLTCGQFMYVIRTRLKLPPEQGIFLFVDGIIPSSNTSMKTLDYNYSKQDGFLYMTYTGENAFG